MAACWLDVHLYSCNTYFRAFFFIPLYSFWHFDDFSWGGMTRRLKDQEEVITIRWILQRSDPLLVLKTWDEYVTKINYNIPFLI